MESPNPSLYPSLISSVFVGSTASPPASWASPDAGTTNTKAMAADLSIVGSTDLERHPAILSIDSRSRSVSPGIPNRIRYDGITYEVLRPEELGCDTKTIPLFGERRPKTRIKLKKNQRQRSEEAEWEDQRKSTIEEKLFNRPFSAYSESDLRATGGDRLPKLPPWLNATREAQHDGSPGVYICKPNKEDFNSRFLEILEALEPIGVEIGVAKILVPDGCLDDPIPWSEVKNRSSHSPLRPASPTAQNGMNTNTETEEMSTFYKTPEKQTAMKSRRRPKKHEYASVRENGIPQVYSMDQRLPLHPESKSNTAPIYHVTSTQKTPVSGEDWLNDINLQLERERRIAAHDTDVQVYTTLQEKTMLARGRDWREILKGDGGGVSKYSSDNVATEELRSYLGLKDPRLTKLPGNIVHGSKQKVEGIHTPYLYIGKAYTLFALHAEDYNAFSLNYQHLGAPKTWRVVCPRDFHLIESFVAGALYPSLSGKEQAKCSQFVRHASLFLPKETLETAEVRSIQFSQNPGELVVTWPLAYHQGWNEGVNVNEACGYGHEGWKQVFASGENDQGEQKVYRPCTPKCIGNNPPIILSFDPEDMGGAVAFDSSSSDDTVMQGIPAATTFCAPAPSAGRRKRPRAQEPDGKESRITTRNSAARLKKSKVIKNEEEEDNSTVAMSTVFAVNERPLEQDIIPRHMRVHREQRTEGVSGSA